MNDKKQNIEIAPNKSLGYCQYITSQIVLVIFMTLISLQKSSTSYYVAF